MLHTIMRRAAPNSGRILIAALACAALQPASAAPVAYRFTTGPFTQALAGENTPAATAQVADLSAALGGMTVSGTFLYDAEAAFLTTFSAGTLVNASLYGNAFLDLSGSVGGHAFGDATGSATVGNEGYAPPVPPPGGTVPTDIFVLTASSPAPAAQDFSGFTLAGLPLVNVRLFWIEGLPLPTAGPDFLVGPDLPAALPAFNGRLALDFSADGTLAASAQRYVFFDGLSVTPAPVPVPAALPLFAAGLAGIASAALRRRNPRR
ncbi:MAG: hypothetical protein AB7Q97_17675 [Gammaproteobacteria bacterium]